MEFKLLESDLVVEMVHCGKELLSEMKARMTMRKGLMWPGVGLSGQVSAWGKGVGMGAH